MFDRLPVAAVRRSLAWLVVVPLLVAACTAEDAVPVDQAPPSSAAGAHVLESNDEMQRLAEQQCLDDPLLEQGEVQAVDPANPDLVLASVTVDCADIR